MYRNSTCKTFALAVAEAGFVLAATAGVASASHRLGLLNEKGLERTLERWPSFVEAINKDPRGMNNPGERAILKPTQIRSYMEKVWSDVPTPAQMVEGNIAAARKEIWPNGITQIHTRLDTATQVSAYYMQLREDGRLPYRIGWHYEQHGQPTAAPVTARQLYEIIGDQTQGIEQTSGWLWLGGVGSEGDGDSVTRACLRDALPALPGKEDYVKKEIEICPNWVAGKKPGDTGAAMLNALNAGWRFVGMHGVGSGMIQLFAERLEDAMKKNPDLTLERVRAMRHGFSHGTMLGKTPELIEVATKYNLYLPVDVYRSFTDETDAIQEFYGPEGFEFQAPIKSLVDAGVHVLSDMSTWQDVETMVTRQHPATGEVMQPEERIDRVTSFKLATIVPAEYNMSETLTGSLEVGKFADFQVIDGDFLDPKEVPDDQIAEIPVLMTVVGNQVVWTSDKAPEEFKKRPHIFAGRGGKAPAAD